MNDETETPDWEAIRARYEGKSETVAAIAALIGIHQSDLSQEAKRRGWAMRRPQQVKVISTSETLRRLRNGLQLRLGQFDAGMNGSGKETNAQGEQDVRATSTLVRTLEKVLELEDRERKQRSAHRHAHLDDAERDELARRVVGLCAIQRRGKW